MPSMPPWSHSTLTSYETCPRRYYQTKVSREIKEPPTEATKWGNTVHQALENRARDGVPLPEVMQSYEPIVSKIISLDGRRLVEERMSVDKNFNVTEWATSWCRGIVDIGIIGLKSGFLFDWKTGKRKVDSDQLKLMALLAMHTYPYIDKVKTGFVWLKDNKLDSEVFTREQVPIIWREFLPRVKRLENAYDKNKWEPKPSGLCKGWCPCTSCEFNGKK